MTTDSCKYCGAKLTYQGTKYHKNLHSITGIRMKCSYYYCPRCFAELRNDVWMTPLFDTPPTPWKGKAT